MQDTQGGSSVSSGGRGKRRAYSPDDGDDMSGSDGERGHSHSHSRTVSSSRAPSTAPPQYYTGHQPPPPGPPQNGNQLGPAILYQAAMDYEIRHALSPRPSTSNASSPTISQTTAPSRREHYAAPIPSGYQQFPADDYYSSSAPQQPPYPPYPQTGSYSTGPGNAGVYASNSYASSRSPAQYVTAQGQGSRSPFRTQQEPPPSGLAALAMHAAQIRPLSPLPKQQKTKSELESALGPPYAR